MEWIVTANTV